MVDEHQIRSLLKEYFKTTGKITINPQTGRVSCTGSVKWRTEGAIHRHLPVHFDKVRNDFDVGYAHLETLEGVPLWVGGNFSCFYNRLTSLTHAPEHVGKTFRCGYNQITSLQNGPLHVGASYLCGHNQLTSLTHAPDTVFNFHCTNNQLTTLEGAPRVINGELSCWGNQLKSLDGLPDIIKDQIWMDDPPPHMPLLRLLAVKDLSKIVFGVRRNDRQDILNPYVGQGRAGALKAAGDLIRAGYKENARW